MNKFLVSVFVFSLMVLNFGPSVVYAQDVDSLLVTNEDESLSDAERFERAKAGLNKALELSLKKVENLTADLEGRQFEEGTKEWQMKTDFLGNLADYKAYYSETLTKVEPLDNLESVQALAQEIKNYRDTAYSPGIEDVVEFILVFYSEDVIETATERLNNVTYDIEKLQALGLVEEGYFEEKISAVNGLLDEASDLRLRAKDILLPVEMATTSTSTHTTTPPESTTTEEVLEAPVETATATPAPATEIVDNNATSTESAELEEETPRGLLEKSLNNVKAAYEIFLEISDSAKNTLGIE